MIAAVTLVDVLVAVVALFSIVAPLALITATWWAVRS